MVLVGIDPHKHTHTAVAVDPTGRQLAQRTVQARSRGHGHLLAWAHRTWPDQQLTWAVEDCRATSARLEADLLAAGQRVVRVPPS